MILARGVNNPKTVGITIRGQAQQRVAGLDPGREL